ncbi:hypothetical protein [Lewinella sp. IMCC34191]|uniref:hypothetical protein n=1 Tax=Lewinella sp. IMCC34191 TaxID=2259172 RepID=UPI0013002642|nr:hypothetical protein [Lewinella sp. IMCC34191]
MLPILAFTFFFFSRIGGFGHAFPVTDGGRDVFFYFVPPAVGKNTTTGLLPGSIAAALPAFWSVDPNHFPFHAVG